ncbi:MAG: hypothetical protein ABEN55_10335, partial [Bradymonadaceae bacterium]
MPTLLVAGLLALGSIGLTACAGNGEAAKPDKSPKPKKKKPKPEAPMPENLAEAPCGNPDWGQLPEQHRIHGDPAEGEATDEPAADGDDEERV